MRRFLISILVLVALLAVVDRVALSAAQHDVAERLQADAKLSTAPSVRIHGFPFLTQLAAGDFDDVDVVMRGLGSGGLRIDRLRVHVRGAHVSIGDVISQDRSRIHVDHASAKLTLTYADLQDFVTRRLANAGVGGTSPPINHSTVTGASVRGADTVVLQTSAGAVTLPLSGLPFGIRLTSAKTTQAGVEVSGEAAGLVLRT